jgi:hypothetical protein
MQQKGFAPLVQASYQGKTAAPARCRLDTHRPRTPPAHREHCSAGVRGRWSTGGQAGAAAAVVLAWTRGEQHNIKKNTWGGLHQSLRLTTPSPPDPPYKKR